MKNVTLLFLLLAVPAVYGQGTKNQPQGFTISKADSLFASQQWKAAIVQYEGALKSQPQNPLAWNRLGYSYHNLLDYDKAMECYHRALESNSGPQLEQIVQARMARVYAAQHDLAKSFECLDHAVTLGYVNLSELQNHEEFVNIRNDERFAVLTERVRNNAFPCLKNSQSRVFDFWIGEWDAYVTGTDNLAGQSRIEMASGGCMILENWTSKGNAPFEGKSMNFIDPTTQKWKQVWIGSSGVNVSEFLNGEYRDGAMRFEFETTVQGAKQLVHFYFFNQGPDQVRQLHETSSDDGKTWVTTYDFTYIRKKK